MPPGWPQPDLTQPEKYASGLAYSSGTAKDRIRDEFLEMQCGSLVLGGHTGKGHLEAEKYSFGHFAVGGLDWHPPRGPNP